MTVITSSKDVEALTLTVVAEFDAKVERIWELWEDPRQLEQWWGPPGWPATFEQHSLVVGGRSNYFMSGPAGEKARGWWRIVDIDAPRHSSSTTVSPTSTVILCPQWNLCGWWRRSSPWTAGPA